jgi:hypothetical protein
MMMVVVMMAAVVVVMVGIVVMLVAVVMVIVAIYDDYKATMPLCFLLLNTAPHPRRFMPQLCCRSSCRSSGCCQHTPCSRAHDG